VNELYNSVLDSQDIGSDREDVVDAIVQWRAVRKAALEALGGGFRKGSFKRSMRKRRTVILRVGGVEHVGRDDVSTPIPEEVAVLTTVVGVQIYIFAALLLINLLVLKLVLGEIRISGLSARRHVLALGKRSGLRPTTIAFHTGIAPVQEEMTLLTQPVEGWKALDLFARENAVSAVLSDGEGEPALVRGIILVGMGEEPPLDNGST